MHLRFCEVGGIVRKFAEISQLYQTWKVSTSLCT